jgi:hypothetical protein
MCEIDLRWLVLEGQGGKIFTEPFYGVENRRKGGSVMNTKMEMSATQLMLGLVIVVGVLAGLLWLAGLVVGPSMEFSTAVLATVVWMVTSILVSGVTGARGGSPGCVVSVLSGYVKIWVLTLLMGISWNEAASLWLVWMGMLLAIYVSLGIIAGLLKAIQSADSSHNVNKTGYPGDQMRGSHTWHGG